MFVVMRFPIIEKLGGEAAVFEHLRDCGLVRTKDALRMWRAAERGVIPGDAARELMRWAEERVIEYAASDFDLQPGATSNDPLGAEAAA